MPDPLQRIGSGAIGGKAQGFARLAEALEALLGEEGGAPYRAAICLPRTIVVTTSIFRAFLAHNGLEAAVAKAVASEDPAAHEAIMRRIAEATFPEKEADAIMAAASGMAGPLAVRSSSLLEDQKGASFAGKYATHFVGSQGAEETRRAALLQAIALVYASTYNTNALAYRRKHGLLTDPEEMAVIVQEVVGSAYKDYFLPALAGVAFSQNGYCWSKEIQKRDGLVRLVFGLGTRAVGRGYVRLFSPAKPLARPEGTEVNNIQKCSQKKVDAIDLKTGELTSVHFRELITDGFDCYPGAQSFVSLRDGTYLYRPVSNLWDAAHVPVLTMDGALTGSWKGLDLGRTMAWLLAGLERQLRFAVDLEFAIRIDPEAKAAQLCLLQARPLAEQEGRRPQPIPELAPDDIIISVERSLPTAYVPGLEYLVSVDDEAYRAWPHTDKQSVARAIGKIGQALKGKRYALIGPGRWGSWNPELGVPVNYAEIAGCSLLIEVARRRATYLPEVSFGSHFFQDLIEDGIAYLPLAPDEPGEHLNEAFFKGPSCFAELLPDEYFRRYDELIAVIHVPSVAAGRAACAILNGELEKAVVFLEKAGISGPSTSKEASL